jgi:hypothetical protein
MAGKPAAHDEIETIGREIEGAFYRDYMGKPKCTYDLLYYAYMKGRNDLKNEMFKESNSKNISDAIGEDG